MTNSKLLSYTSNLIGSQAIVGCMPCKFHKDDLMIFNSFKNMFLPLKKINSKLIRLCDELLIYDCENEGHDNSFNKKIINYDLINEKKNYYFWRG